MKNKWGKKIPRKSMDESYEHNVDEKSSTIKEYEW